MEKIFFDKTTFIWKTKLNRTDDKLLFLKEANDKIKSLPNNKTDGYKYNEEWEQNFDFMSDFKIKTKLDEIVQSAIDYCKKIYMENNLTYNKINTDAWINVVRSKNPIQSNYYNGNDKYHIHADIQKKIGYFHPNYTYVYYIQMPDVMNEKDGVLYFKSKDNIEYFIRPEEDDLIIMEGDMPHSPNTAPSANLNRIVFAGNVGFEFIKKTNSLI